MANTNNILIISDCSFYGGGESFVANTLTELCNFYNAYFLVKNDYLYNLLPVEKRLKFRENSFIKQLLEAKGIIKKLSISSVILNGGNTLFYTPFLRNTAKTVMYCHSTYKYVPIGIKRFLYIFLIHFCYFFAYRVIHVSKYSFSEQKIARKKAITIYNGINILPYKKRELSLPLHFLFVGRTDKSKGIDIIVDAFKQINIKIAILHIVGCGEYDATIIKINNKNIVYHGFQNEVSSYYENCNVFITLSEIENCSLSILDALNHSIPVITTMVGGNPELVNSSNGFPVDRTSADLLQVIYAITDNPEQLIEKGEKANETAKTLFNRKNTIEKITNVLRSIL